MWLVRFQPDHFFPHPWLACCRQINSAIAQRTPTHGPQVHSWHAETSEMSSNNFPFFHFGKRTMVVPQASPATGVAHEVSERSESQTSTTQWAEIVDVYTCETLSSDLWEASYWPKNSLRSNLKTSTFRKFSMPARSRSWSVLTHTLRTWPLQTWWLRPCHSSSTSHCSDF